MTTARIGLTGGLAAGKSTVAGLLEAAGFRVVDADELVADLYRSGQAGVAVVRQLFGSEVLDADGNVDHTVLARLVFEDPTALTRLEEQIHPLVRQRFAEMAETAETAEIAQQAPDGRPIVLEATRLVEAGYAPDFDVILTVEADSGLQLARAVARGHSAADAQRRLDAQGDGELRRRAAHRVIWNNGSLEELEARVAEVVQWLETKSHD